MSKYILAIDQGTSGTTTVLYDRKGRIAGKAYREFRQIYPRPGWVEHDAEEIWRTVLATVRGLCAGKKARIAALGITNQRETTVVWDRRTGKPIHNAIVWQCRRTADYCRGLSGHAKHIRRVTGLPVDAYFSGSKIRWILRNVEGYDRKNVIFGTIDSWLVWKLTDGGTHATDYTNASRTMLYDLRRKRWDPKLCRLLSVPLAMLPKVKKSADDYGVVTSIPAIRDVPILGVAGDQQAALFGQACFERGELKNTYGTGCFLLLNTGKKAIISRRSLITTLAIDGSGNPCYALEGSVFIAGAAIQWLRDELKILARASHSEKAARAAKDNAGVYLVPAFVGLGAPHWDMQARGALVGLSRGANRNHIIRAALEAMAYQSNDVLAAMEKDTGLRYRELAVDGGAAANDFLMQFQADVINRPVARPAVIETTSRGAAFLAGLKSGFWKDSRQLRRLKKIERVFRPKMKRGEREQLLAGWARALRQTMVK